MPWHKERELAEGAYWVLSRFEEWPSIHDLIGTPSSEGTSAESFGLTVRKAEP